MKFIPRQTKTIAVVCNQFGDTGKGKVVDLITDLWRPNRVVRSCGADNAGHTIKVGDLKIVTHIIPSGIIHDKDGVISVISRGSAVNLIMAKNELIDLSKKGITYNGLRISSGAKMILPQHIIMDSLRELGPGKIGTTKRGVGPIYSDHAARVGITIGDLENKDIFFQKIVDNLKEKFIIFNNYDRELIKNIIYNIPNGEYFYSERDIIDIDNVVEYYHSFLYQDFFKDMICNTEAELRSVVGKEKVLLEGAQGVLLDIDDGIYPYVTSSNCTPDGLAHGAGLRASQIDLCFGIVKVPYMTRVGDGPFPTEIGGLNAANKYKEELEKHNISIDKIDEQRLNLLNGDNDILKAAIIASVGNEIGATTKRPRRIGWLDIPALKYAIQFSGRDIIITKPDVFSGSENIQICIGYIYKGKDIFYCSKKIKNGDNIDYFIPRKEIIEKCVPKYITLSGWREDIQSVRNYKKLPKGLKQLINFIEKNTGARVRAVSVGPERSQIVIR